MEKNFKSKKVGSVLVIGGGIAGIQSALDLAEQGFYVYLVESSPSIGGVMAQLDKTFPTNDCSMCILSPKLVECGRHLNIEVITLAEVLEIKGEPSNFQVKILKRPRYIDVNKCTGCGFCTTNCPVEQPNEFDVGLKSRKAIYIPFPQAVPLKYTIHKGGLQPCRGGCPAGIGAPGYVTLVARGKFYEALKVIKDRLPFPSICGRVCHRPCEKECTRNKIDEPVSIAHIKRFVGDLELKIPVAEEPPIKTKAENVAIVGGGPAGLTAAHDLAKMGYHVTIYESAPVLGGMMRFGIPTFRLPKEILEREISDILTLGIKVRLNTHIGKDLFIEDIFNRGHKAIFLAIGAQKGKKLNIPGEELEGVFQAIDFLKEVNLGRIITTPIVNIDYKLCNECGKCASVCLYRAIEVEENNNKKKKPKILKFLCKGCGKCASVCPSKAIRLTGYNEAISQIGEKVVVIGGGNAALDTARTALRLGAKEVTVLYRRSRQEMPAEPEWEIDETEREGVKFLYLVTPTRIIGENGHIKAIECVKMKLEKELDNTGRRKVKPIPHSEFIMDADSLILAIGQEVDVKNLAKSINLELTPWGTIKVDPVSLMTSVEGIFCGGDAVLGAGTVIEAIAAGKEAAISIDRYLRGLDLKEGRLNKKEIVKVPLKGIKEKRKVPMRYLPIEKRKNNFEEVELGYSEEEAIEEARRCLMCGGCVECFECVRTCPAQAVNHQQKAEEIELNVGAIVVSAGFDEYSPEELTNLGYKKYKNVVTSIEFERILSASGPFGGEVLRPSDKKHPENIAFIQCVGSRDEKLGQGYCSSVCCMYAIKEAVIAKEHAGGRLDTTIFFMDMRCYGKDFDKYYERAKKEYGVRFVRSKVYKIEELDGTGDLNVIYVGEDGKKYSEKFDMVVLSVGFLPPENAVNLAKRTGLNLNKYNFVQTKDFNPVQTSREGIYVCGVFSGPKDIPETVMQASAASSEVSLLLHPARKTLTREKTYPEEIDVQGQEPRIGVFVCHCGINIGGVVNVPEVRDFAKNLPNVVYCEDNLYTCSQDTQERIKEKIKEYNLNRVVVASCSPRTHEALFQETIREAGLNKYLFEMANIRDQCSWVHMQEKEKATEKAKELVKMAVAKARMIEPLKELKLELKHSALVIGGGISGMNSALNLAEQGFQVYLIEKNSELGGLAKRIKYTIDGKDVQKYLNDLIEKVKNNKNIKIITEATIVEVSGYVGNFKTGYMKKGTGFIEEVETGVIIVAVGAEEHKPDEYLYGKDKRVITQLELEERISNSQLLNPKSIVMIQCVGSRNSEHPYCSRFCCSQAIKNALKIKEISPDTEVYILYRDIRTYGLSEDYYHLAREKGVIFIRYEEDKKPEVKVKDGKLIVETYNEILGEKINIYPDLLVLSVGAVPYPENKELASLLKVPVNQENFFLEAHVKLRPVDFATDGIFVAGLCHSPKTIQECILQSQAAAGRATTILVKDKIMTSGIVSYIDPDICAGCKICVSICPYKAIEFDDINKFSRVREALCKGCGTCVSACPSGAAQALGFKDNQILAQIKELFTK